MNVNKSACFITPVLNLDSARGALYDPAYFLNTYLGM
jgi:hypothetical protein